MRHAANFTTPARGAFSGGGVFTSDSSHQLWRSSMRIRKVQLCSGLLSLLVCAAVALAQNATGSITGAVTDPNNEVIANAAITVTSRATFAIKIGRAHV